MNKKLNEIYIDQISYIDLVLQNGDYYRIYREDVNSVWLGNIVSNGSINIIGQFYVNIIAKQVVINIKNKNYQSQAEKSGLDDKYIKPFIQRMIKEKDITSICVGNEQGDYLQYYVDTKDLYEDRELDFYNVWQHVHILIASNTINITIGNPEEMK